VLLPGPGGALAAVAGLEPLAEQEMAVATWAHVHRRAAGRGAAPETGAIARIGRRDEQSTRIALMNSGSFGFSRVSPSASTAGRS